MLGEGQALAQVQEDEFLISIFLSHLGIVKLRAGDLEQAIKLAQEALALRRKLDLGAWATADLTTLAAAYMALGDTEQAQGYARQAIVILDEGGAKEAEYPHQDYYICYQVLAASKDEEAARAALQSAHDLVMARAEQIADPVARLSFLEQVEIHHAILSEYGKYAE
jgi:tetratricopeptide (TPR) repeat protein